LPQAGDDPIDVRHLFAAKPENIRRAGKLLFHCSRILLLRKSGIQERDAKADS
jgi:hypothetical protein